MNEKEQQTEFWRRVLSGTHPLLRANRRMNKLLPSDPRCKLCDAPFKGVGGFVMRRVGKSPWEKNPMICNGCFRPLDRHPGGAEVDVMLLFADVRGSTPLATSLGPSRFSALMNRFFATASKAITDSGGFIEKFVGDEVAGVYLPGWIGPDHGARAFAAALRILRETGNADGLEPWVSVGIGMHFGAAYVGSIGTHEVPDFGGGASTSIQALGPDIAHDGQIIAMVLADSYEAAREAAYRVDVSYAAEHIIGSLDGEVRTLELKGIARRLSVRAVRAS